MRLRILTLAILLAVSTPAPGSTQSAPASSGDLTTLLAQPLTSGVVALLGEAAADPRVQARLADALASPDATVRAVAARIVASTRSVAQIGALRRAILAEGDTVAAPEIVRSLVGLGGPDTASFVLPELARLGPAAMAMVVEVTARVRPDTLGAVLTAMQPPASLNVEIGQLIALGMRQDPSRVDTLIAVLQSFDRPDAWSGCLNAMLWRAPAVPPRLLEAALANKSAGVRADAVWTAARLLLMQRDPSTAPSAGLEKSAQAADASPWEAFGREIIARSLGAKPVPGPWADAIRERGDMARPLAAFAESKAFTKTERDLLASRFPEEVHAAGPSIPRHLALRFQPTLRMRTLDWPAPGVARDLLRVTGCSPDKHDARVFSSVRYRPEGTVKSGGIDPTGLTPECVRAGKAALMLAIAGSDSVVVGESTEVLLIVLEPEALACADAFGAVRQARQRKPVTSGQDVRAPRKIRNVNPVYPPRAEEAKLQGVVVLEAVISSEGCVASVELQRNVHSLLDLAAFDAVLRWRYEPVLIDGAPVPVMMTVTVNFSLR